MIELSKHIEVLLLENDCVIVPGLGGFIAHYRSAYYDEQNHIFFPPARTIGFSPQLVMNDGLLVQSYMQAYNTDFPDATRKIEKVIASLKERLYNEGQLILPHIGTLYYNVNGTYEFEPCAEGFYTPSLYGFGAISCLPAIPVQTVYPVSSPASIDTKPPVVQLSRAVEPEFRPKKKTNQWLRYVATAAAAVVLFCLFSVPVSNTYTDDANYASLYSSTLFDLIRNQSAVTNVIPVEPQAPKKDKDEDKPKAKRVRSNVNTLKPVSVRTEKVAQPKRDNKPLTQEEKKETAAAEAKPQPITLQNGYYIIVASLPTVAAADRQVEQLTKAGHKGAQVVKADGRFRVAVARYDKQVDAYRQISILKQEEAFKQAWVYTAK